MSKPLHQKFKVIIEFDLAEENFDVSIINMSKRKGFVDIEGMKAKFQSIIRFLQVEGLIDIEKQIELEQMN